MTSVRRPPRSDEYAAYYAGYISELPVGDIIITLRTQIERTLQLLKSVPASRVHHAYAPGKWTTMEVVRHVVDTEWGFTYRGLSFARADTPPLPGMEQDEFMAGARKSPGTWPALLDEFRHLRSANTLLFETMDDAVLHRTGTASGNLFTVRSIPWIIAGHEAHHMKVLRERYLG